ncbi:hypothetical protein G6O69_15605 [Pseudenhygromyxa sp. WMMC2535]|uniref:hypothetical protein n=1 Tax=Pseudenhygromyxa sp. WMMC2535 TaxID=2712867 RepID=UPI001555225F|nr:hypothetical protein [Pseudenhygromyxa sp. WMMC2535]NVB39269.1 hypothetical protein [Pseudenhygromyxa sp. WMMC2535]
MLTLLLPLLTFFGLAFAPTAAWANPKAIRVPLTIHVGNEGGRSVVREHHIVDSVRRANRDLARFGIHLWIRDIVPMQAGPRVESSDERLDLARETASDGSVHVFFVDRVALANPRKGDRRVSGMHWRYHGFDARIRAREYLVVARDAPNTTLVHEVGHAFGLSHDSDTDNLMCSCRRGVDPAFDSRQGRRLRGGARRFMSRHGRLAKRRAAQRAARSRRSSRS